MSSYYNTCSHIFHKNCFENQKEKIEDFGSLLANSILEKDTASFKSLIIPKDIIITKYTLNTP